MVSGSYRGKTDLEVAWNMHLASEAAKILWQQGYAVICPHLNSAHFDGICEDSVWLKGYLEILKRCDGIFVLRNSQSSLGTQKEIELAKQLGKFILYQ